MPNHRRVNSYTRQRSEFVGDAYEANVFGGSLNYKTDGIYLVSENGSFIRLNRNGLFMRDADILLKNGSLSISGGNVAIYSAPNGLTSNTYMFMSNDGLSAFKNGVTSFFIDARTGNVSLAGIITASAGNIGTWQIYPNGLSASYSGYIMYLSPEHGINYNNNFFVDSSGNMSAFNAYLAGEIVAARGRIGTWDIYNNGLSATVSVMDYSSLSSMTGALSSYSMSISSLTSCVPNIILKISPQDGIFYNNVFVVDYFGNLTAQSSTIRGTICADSGYLNNLEVKGTLTGGMYWFDSNHYLNLSNSTLSAINMNDKFVVLTTGDVYLSNLNATGAIYSTSAYLGGWTVDQSSIFQRFQFVTGDQGAVYLSTSAIKSSSSYPSGRAIGLQVFNEGSSTGKFFDASFGTNLIDSASACGLLPVSGNFANHTIPRDPSRMGIQVSTGLGTSSANILFEISTTTGDTTSLEWPYVKAQIAGWKFDQYGFYSCNDDFRISSSANKPEVIIGTTTASFIKLGLSSSKPYLTFGTTSNTINFLNENITINVQSATSDRYYVINQIPTSPNETTSKFYVDSLTSGGYWSITANNVYNIPNIVSVGASASGISVVSGYKFSVSGGRVGFTNTLCVGDLLNSFDPLTSNTLAVFGDSYFSNTVLADSSITSGRHYLTSSSLTAPLVGIELASKDYVDSLTGHAKTSLSALDDVDITSQKNKDVVQYDISSNKWINTEFGSLSSSIVGTPNYITKFDPSGTGLVVSIIEQQDGANVSVHGDMFVEGVLQATDKYFNIPHPSFNDPSIRLIHSVTETNRKEVHYSGKSKIIDRQCAVLLPKYFKDLVKQGSERVLITPIGMIDDIYYMGIDFENNKLIFRTKTTQSCEFFWFVFGERKDSSPLKEEIGA